MTLACPKLYDYGYNTRLLRQASESGTRTHSVNFLRELFSSFAGKQFTFTKKHLEV